MANTVLGTASNILNAVKSWANGKFALSSKVGAANGIATLDADGKVPSSQLPSYVDDVLEYSAKSSFPATGETGKIYVNTADNKTYRWSGTTYVEISASLALGETSSTAYAGDKGKAVTDNLATHTGNSTIHVTSTEKTTWNNKGTYSKPSAGIPKTDLASDVQTSLGKADTALQSYTEKYTGTYSKPSTGIPKDDLASAVQTSLGKADTAYQKPSTGIPKTDLSSDVQTSLGKADTALQSYTEIYTGTYSKPSTGIPKDDLASAVQTSLGKADSAYQKPSTGIPKTDLASAIQTSLGKADTALQSHQDISGKADKASITAGTAGTSSATSGASLSVPYVTMNAQGIVTGYGTHTHTVTGFLTSHQSLAGYVPTTRKVAGKALSSDVTINIADIADLELMTVAEMTAILEA